MSSSKKPASHAPQKASAMTPSEKLIRDTRRLTKPVYTAEQKVNIVMEGIRQEQSIAELCRKYGISSSTFYTWNKEFIEAGKRQLSGDTIRQATSEEVAELSHENTRLKEDLADCNNFFASCERVD